MHRYRQSDNPLAGTNVAHNGNPDNNTGSNQDPATQASGSPSATLASVTEIPPSYIQNQRNAWQRAVPPISSLPNPAQLPNPAGLASPASLPRSFAVSPATGGDSPTAGPGVIPAYPAQYYTLSTPLPGGLVSQFPAQPVGPPAGPPAAATGNAHVSAQAANPLTTRASDPGLSAHTQYVPVYGPTPYRSYGGFVHYNKPYAVAPGYNYGAPQWTASNSRSNGSHASHGSHLSNGSSGSPVLNGSDASSVSLGSEKSAGSRVATQEPPRHKVLPNTTRNGGSTRSQSPDGMRQKSGQPPIKKTRSTEKLHAASVEKDPPTGSKPASGAKPSTGTENRLTIGSVAATLAKTQPKPAVPVGTGGFRALVPAGSSTASSASSSLVRVNAVGQHPMNAVQRKKIDSVNMMIAGNSQTDERAVCATGAADCGALQQLRETIPPVSVLAGLPHIPAGFVPLLMSPQGFLVPMQYEAAEVAGQTVHTLKPAWGSSVLKGINEKQVAGDGVGTENPALMLGSPNTGKKTGTGMTHAGSSHAKDVVGGVDQSLVEIKPRPSSRQRILRTERLAAMRLCLMSRESYEQAVKSTGRATMTITVELTAPVKEHEDLVREYAALTSDIHGKISGYQARRDQMSPQFNALSTELCSSPADRALHGLERDVRECRDYGLVQQKTMDAYLRARAFRSYVDETLATYGAGCLEYTGRLLKFKKLLLRGRAIIDSRRDQLYYVNSAKSEKLWRNCLEGLARLEEEESKHAGEGVDRLDGDERDEGASGVDSSGGFGSGNGGSSGADPVSHHPPTYMALPAHPRGTTPSGESDSSSASIASTEPMLSSRRHSTRISSVVGHGNRKNGRMSTMDEPIPLLTDADFESFTDPKSKLYDHYVVASRVPEVADQSDIVELIEFFRVKSTLQDLYDLLDPGTRDRKRKAGANGSHSSAGSTRESTPVMAPGRDEDDPYARYYPGRKRQKTEGRDEDGVSVVFHHQQKSNGHNLTSSLDSLLSDKDRVRWLCLDEKEIRTKFTKIYPKPVGLSDAEIESDLREIRGLSGQNHQGS